MTDPDTISADYTLRPSELAETLALLVEARQPCVVWGPAGSAKSQIAQQVAAAANRRYVDVRALLLDPVDLRGIPWRDSDGRTRWAPPAFLPPTDDPGLWLITRHRRTVYIPWRRYNGWSDSVGRAVAAQKLRMLQVAAAPHHPAWHHPAWQRCRARVRDLHARNVAILVGVNMREPVHAMVCWTEGGRVEDGTGMVIRLARHTTRSRSSTLPGWTCVR